MPRIPLPADLALRSLEAHRLITELMLKSSEEWFFNRHASPPEFLKELSTVWLIQQLDSRTGLPVQGFFFSKDRLWTRMVRETAEFPTREEALTQISLRRLSGHAVGVPSDWRSKDPAAKHPDHYGEELK